MLEHSKQQEQGAGALTPELLERQAQGSVDAGVAGTAGAGRSRGTRLAKLAGGRGEDGIHSEVTAKSSGAVARRAWRREKRRRAGSGRELHVSSSIDGSTELSNKQQSDIVLGRLVRKPSSRWSAVEWIC
jgi:hypothetical protein